MRSMYNPVSLKPLAHFQECPVPACPHAPFADYGYIVVHLVKEHADMCKDKAAQKLLGSREKKQADWLKQAVELNKSVTDAYASSLFWKWAGWDDSVAVSGSSQGRDY